MPDSVNSRAGLPSAARLALARLHPAALGTAVGSVSALWLFSVTIWTAVEGTEPARRGLGLLSQYLPGYRVTAPGSVVGLMYALALGFGAGYALAAVRNAIIRLYLSWLRRRAEHEQLGDMLDRLG